MFASRKGRATRPRGADFLDDIHRQGAKLAKECEEE